MKTVMFDHNPNAKRVENIIMLLCIFDELQGA